MSMNCEYFVNPGILGGIGKCYKNKEEFCGDYGGVGICRTPEKDASAAKENFVLLAWLCVFVLLGYGLVSLSKYVLKSSYTRGEIAGVFFGLGFYFCLILAVLLILVSIV